MVQDAGYRNFAVYIHTIKHGYKTDVFTVDLVDSVTSSPSKYGTYRSKYWFCGKH